MSVSVDITSILYISLHMFNIAVIMIQLTTVPVSSEGSCHITFLLIILIYFRRKHHSILWRSELPSFLCAPLALFLYAHNISIWISQHWQLSDLCQKYSIWLDCLMTDNTFSLTRNPFWQYFNTGLCLLSVQINKELLVEGHRQYKMVMWKGGPGTAAYFSDIFDPYKLILDKHRWVAAVWDFPYCCLYLQKPSTFSAKPVV